MSSFAILHRPLRRLANRLSDLSRFHPLTWRYLHNLGPALAYQLERCPMGHEAQRVLADLDRDGVALTSVCDLLGTTAIWEEAQAEVECLERQHLHHIERIRVQADKASTRGEKNYQYSLLGDEPLLDPRDVFVRLALMKPVLDIVHGYFQLFATLRFYNVLHTLPTSSSPRQSQLWHRDGGRRGDRHIVKMFVLLSDVDEGAGPFCYAKGSHFKKRLAKEPDYILEPDGTHRTTDEQMAHVVDRSAWFTGIGKKGSIVFADTAGYHKGGFCSEKDRLIYVSMWTSHADRGGELFRRPPKLQFPPDEDQARVLRGTASWGRDLWETAFRATGRAKSRS